MDLTPRERWLLGELARRMDFIHYSQWTWAIKQWLSESPAPAEPVPERHAYRLSQNGAVKVEDCHFEQTAAPAAPAPDLLPCPFCGSRMIVREHSAFHPQHQTCHLAHDATFELSEYDYPSWNARLSAPSREPLEQLMRGAAMLHQERAAGFRAGIRAALNGAAQLRRMALGAP